VTDQLRVALLVAMRNEVGHIRQCLESILAQDYPSDLVEIWVLDGQSTDQSWAVAADVLGSHAGAYLVANPGITQARGWNLGIARSSADVLGIVSAHAELAPNYVTQAVETLERTKADMVGGPARAVSLGLVGEAVAVGQSTRFGVGSATFRYVEVESEVDTVFMGLCRRSVFQRVGVFDPMMDRNQDDEFSFRLRERGGRIVCNPAIRSRYHNRTTLRRLWRQYVAYGFWKVRVILRHPRQASLSHLVPAAFVTSLLVLSAGAPWWGPWPFGAVVALYAASSVVASVVAARGRWRVLPLLPLVYAVLHVGYGAGFLGGLVRLARGAGAGAVAGGTGEWRPAP